MTILPLTKEQEKMTAKELAIDFEKNPTGSIILQKRRRRLIKARLRQECQAIADSFMNKDKWPNAVAEHKEDSFGKYVKIYYEGKSEPPMEEAL